MSDRRVAPFNDAPCSRAILIKYDAGMHAEGGGGGFGQTLHRPPPPIGYEGLQWGSPTPLCGLQHVLGILCSFCIQPALASENK